MSAVRPAEPDLGLVVPGWSLRALFGAVALALCLALAAPGFWLVVSLLLAVTAMVVPRWLTAWFLIGVLAFTVLLHELSLADWRVYVLIAGAHSLHVLACWTLIVPPDARLQPAALLPSARRFLLVQVPAQAVAVGAIALATSAAGGSLLGLAVIAGAAVLVLVIVLAGPLLRPPRP